ncbi:hypothetical protein NDU88_005147 [Pleurodeles waltl]|uniref:Uncharacterized protein n=1 Tax=Pleurodeles waltl TaxID=8319 RepID=A0AAV7PEI8_PLEWA|nr:hypothetical protein NDU88_005147 [Pleurodeles waltl]
MPSYDILHYSAGMPTESTSAVQQCRESLGRKESYLSDDEFQLVSWRARGTVIYPALCAAALLPSAALHRGQHPPPRGCSDLSSWIPGLG